MTGALIAGTRRTLITLEAITAAAAIVGGLLLAAVPDGRLLAANPDVLAGTPFRSWQLPGLLLLVLVGGDFTLAAFGVWRRTRWASDLSMLAGMGLIAFELAELVWLGFQPLEVVFAAVGLAVVLLARPLVRAGSPR